MKRLLLLLLVACRHKHAAKDDAAPKRDAARAIDAPSAWPELASITKVEPVRQIALPVRPGVPRFDVGGPVVLGDVAVVGSSQFGFLAVDIHDGHIAWTKPAGEHLAPPVVVGGSVVLLGECLNAQPVADTMLGCVRVVTATGADQGYLAVHGKGVEPFAGEPGEQHTWVIGEHALRWRRGDAAVDVDLLSGVAKLAPAQAPPVVVTYRGKTYAITQDADGLLHGAGATTWQTTRAYSQLIGAVLLPEQGPMIRAANAGAYAGQPEINLFDIDATGSMHGQVAFPVPGIGLIGHAIDAVGNTALAVRLDRSLERDFIAGYAANMLLMWVWPLPHQPRPDPVGLAVANDAVVVFHDGDTLTILPELSAPPTAPGAAKPPSENTTP
ncbi:MAG: hypothetical protein JO257_33495 [Deltaproteobacteria bacterium]|nr:hypothetical protein [Deltaproteobacteria bacterium]